MIITLRNGKKCEVGREMPTFGSDGVWGLDNEIAWQKNYNSLNELRLAQLDEDMKSRLANEQCNADL